MNWYAYEAAANEKGYQNICGIDEAGRGPLAGPVFAAAVILPQGLVIDGLNDSKKMTEKKREALFEVIQKEAIGYSIAFATEQEIDEINILQATFLAMRRAYEGLNVPVDYVLVDGNRMPDLGGIAGEPVVKGDAQSANIAAASILAKVSRDRVMAEVDKLYPEYQFAKHKGYGTKLHRELILQYGMCPVHRRSFMKKILGEIHE